MRPTPSNQTMLTAGRSDRSLVIKRAHMKWQDNEEKFTIAICGVALVILLIKMFLAGD